MSNWLDVYFRQGIKLIQYLSAAMTARPNLNFLGAGVSVADNSSNNSTDVTIAGGTQGTLTGDVTTPGGGSLVTTVTAISGSSPIAITPNVLQWVAGASPQLKHTGNGPLNGNAPVVKVTPQSANAGGNSGAGGVTFDLQVPTGTGREAFVNATDGGNAFFDTRPLTGQGYSQAFIYLGSPATAPTTSNYEVFSDGQDVRVNAPAGGGVVSLRESDNEILQILTPSAPVIRQKAASGNGSITRYSGQSSNGANGNGGTIRITGGDLNGSGLRGPAQLCLGAASPQQMVEVAEVVAGQRVVALCRASAVTSTQVPTGDGVAYLANAATNPSSNPVSGGVLYSNAGAATWRGTSGTTTAMAPA